jgi:ribosomal protein S18 acetylase RimI-like enzyme
MDPEIRDAIPNDLPAMIAILVDDVIGRQHESEAYADDYARAFEAIRSAENNELIVAVRDEAVVGMLQITYSPGLTRRGGWRATIETVRVRSDMRRMGIGAALIRHAIDRARKRGCRIAQLTAHNSRTNAHRFYESLGFSASHIGMKMTITPAADLP